MTAYHELLYYDITLDENVGRLSMFNAQGDEFFMVVPRKPGKSWREERAKALDAIEEAIAHDLQPGMVVPV